jgi:HEPN domain-containing protein
MPPPDPEKVAETRSWLTKAQIDLRAAHVAITAQPPMNEDAVFHCQQAVEKALKGLLVWHDIVFRKTHSIEEIGEQCLEACPSLRSVIDRAVPLTECVEVSLSRRC